jgi:class 3 adenylate cyclase
MSGKGFSSSLKPNAPGLSAKPVSPPAAASVGSEPAKGSSTTNSDHLSSGVVEGVSPMDTNFVETAGTGTTPNVEGNNSELAVSSSSSISQTGGGYLTTGGINVAPRNIFRLHEALDEEEDNRDVARLVTGAVGASSSDSNYGDPEIDKLASFRRKKKRGPGATPTSAMSRDDFPDASNPLAKRRSRSIPASSASSSVTGLGVVPGDLGPNSSINLLIASDSNAAEETNYMDSSFRKPRNGLGEGEGGDGESSIRTGKNRIKYSLTTFMTIFVVVLVIVSSTSMFLPPFIISQKSTEMNIDSQQKLLHRMVSSQVIESFRDATTTAVSTVRALQTGGLRGATNWMLFEYTCQCLNVTSNGIANLFIAWPGRINLGCGRLGLTSQHLHIINLTDGVNIQLQDVLQVPLVGGQTLVLNSTVELLGTFDQRTRPWYINGMAGNGPSWSTVYIDFFTKLPIYTFTFPFYNSLSTATPSGLVAVDLEIGTIIKVLRQVDLPGSCIALFETDTGSLLAISQPQVPTVATNGNNTLTPVTVEAATSTILRRALAGLPGGVSVRNCSVPQQWSIDVNTIFSQDTEVFLDTLVLGSNADVSLRLIFVIPDTSFNEEVATSFLICFIFFWVALVLFPAVGALGTRHFITQPLNELRQDLEMIMDNPGEYVEQARLKDTSAVEEISNIRKSAINSVEKLSEMRAFVPYSFWSTANPKAAESKTNAKSPAKPEPMREEDLESIDSDMSDEEYELSVRAALAHPTSQANRAGSISLNPNSSTTEGQLLQVIGSGSSTAIPAAAAGKNATPVGPGGAQSFSSSGSAQGPPSMVSAISFEAAVIHSEGSTPSASRHPSLMPTPPKSPLPPARNKLTGASTRTLTKQPVTIMVLNIRNFGLFSLKLTEQQFAVFHSQLVDFINRSVMSHRGQIDYFYGDHFVCSFNAVHPLATHKKQAVLCALNIRDHIARFEAELMKEEWYSRLTTDTPNQTPRNVGLSTSDAPSRVRAGLSSPRPAESALSLSCGIASGKALCGMMGTDTFLRYCCVGDCVGHAFQMERACNMTWRSLHGLPTPVSSAGSNSALFSTMGADVSPSVAALPAMLNPNHPKNQFNIFALDSIIPDIAAEVYYQCVDVITLYPQTKRQHHLLHKNAERSAEEARMLNTSVGDSPFQQSLGASSTAGAMSGGGGGLAHSQHGSGAGKPPSRLLRDQIVICPMEPIVIPNGVSNAANDEWMYKLAQREASDPYQFLNKAFAEFVFHDVKKGQLFLAKQPEREEMYAAAKAQQLARIRELARDQGTGSVGVHTVNSTSSFASLGFSSVSSYPTSRKPTIG